MKLEEDKEKSTPTTFTCEDLDKVCMTCCKYVCCIPCCEFVSDKCTHNKLCQGCLHSNCCNPGNKQKEIKVLNNSIPGAYRRSPMPQRRSKDSSLYPTSSTGKTQLVTADNASLHGNDSKTSSLRSKAESEEEEMNREDEQIRFSGQGRSRKASSHEKTISVIVEQPVSMSDHEEQPMYVKRTQMKVARSMDSVEFVELLNSDSDGEDSFHGNADLTEPGVRVSYHDVCMNGIKIIVTDYDYGKKCSDSISSESSIGSQIEHPQEVVQQVDNSTNNDYKQETDQFSEITAAKGDIFAPVIIETENVLIRNYRQTSV